MGVLTIAAAICFHISQRRVRRVKDLATEEDMAKAKPQLQQYRAQIREGISWIERTPHTMLAIVSRDGLKLAARYYQNGNSARTVLLFHGYRSLAHNDFSCGARAYYELGCNLLLVDQRAHGNSEGRYIGYGVLERYDCLLWIEEINRRYPGQTLFLAGMSMGATTVLMAAGLGLPDNVKGIVADCGFTSPWEILGCVLDRRLHIRFLKYLLLPLTSLCSRLIAGYGYRDANTVDAMKKNTVPVFFVHGTADQLVPKEMSQRAYDALSAEKQILFVEGAEHAASFLVEPARYCAMLKQFLNGR